MGKIYESIDERLQTWIGQQHLFFVGTAPDQTNAHLNISPKGARDSFRVSGSDHRRLSRSGRQRHRNRLSPEAERADRRHVLCV